MVCEQLVKALCALAILGLASGAKINPKQVDISALKKLSFNATFQPFWDDSFCDDFEDFDAFPHPDSCQEYLICYGGVIFEGSCPAGQLFDPWNGWCEWADNVQCLTDVCPPPGSNEVRLLPSEWCEWYYICINGVPALVPCRPGQHWNAVNEYCDDPENAGCDVRVVAFTDYLLILIILSPIGKYFTAYRTSAMPSWSTRRFPSSPQLQLVRSL